MKTGLFQIKLFMHSKTVHYPNVFINVFKMYLFCLNNEAPYGHLMVNKSFFLYPSLCFSMFLQQTDQSVADGGWTKYMCLTAVTILQRGATIPFDTDIQGNLGCDVRWPQFSVRTIWNVKAWSWVLCWQHHYIENTDIQAVRTWTSQSHLANLIFISSQNVKSFEHY